MPYTIAEEKAHVATHLLGVIFIICLGRPLINLMDEQTSKISLWIFLFTFLFVFASSTIYHASRKIEIKRRLKILDHVAIYFFIAGSNTPYLSLISHHDWAPYFLIFMWALVLFGTLYKVLGWDLKSWISLAFYLFMGWLGIVTVILIYPVVTGVTLQLIILGGIFYSIGAYFYHQDHRRWYHTIWHIFVLLGAFTHYTALYCQLI